MCSLALIILAGKQWSDKFDKSDIMNLSVKVAYI